MTKKLNFSSKGSTGPAPPAEIPACPALGALPPLDAPLTEPPLALAPLEPDAVAPLAPPVVAPPPAPLNPADAPAVGIPLTPAAPGSLRALGPPQARGMQKAIGEIARNVRRAYLGNMPAV